MRRHQRASFAFVLAILVGLGVLAVRAQGPPDPLERGFRNPPASARPRVWWHWMNGNITKDGIKADVEWMKRVGMPACRPSMPR